MNEADRLIKDALSWLQANYSDFAFFVERDVVWTLQLRLSKQIKDSNLTYRIYNDYPMLAGSHRSLSADIVILDNADRVAMAAEFKYEPSHLRKDILQNKLPVVAWGKDGVGKDVTRINEFVARGKAKVAYAIFIDEGGYFCRRLAHPGSEWLEWGNGVWVMLSRAEGKA